MSTCVCTVFETWRGAAIGQAIGDSAIARPWLGQSQIILIQVMPPSHASMTIRLHGLKLIKAVGGGPQKQDNEQEMEAEFKSRGCPGSPGERVNLFGVIGQGAHTTMITKWKRALIDSASDLFYKGHKSPKKKEALVTDLYREIG